MNTHRTQLIDLMMEGISDTYNKQWKLAAIWLNSPLKTSKETKRRITKGDLVKVENGKLINCTGEPNCRIVECYGNMANTWFKLDVLHLSTNEVITIEI